MKTSVIIYSGGLDSTVLLTRVAKEHDKVYALNFWYGSKHNAKERQAARTICSLLNIPLYPINLDFINELFKSDLLQSGGEIPEGHYEEESMKRTVVPFRNGIMLSIAVGFAESVGAEHVMIASHAGDHAIYPDCRTMFNEAMYKAASIGTQTGVKVLAPFSHLTKKSIVLHGAEINAPMHLSYSCYKGGDKHCGKCGTCTERIEAFKLAGYIDKAEYDIDIDWSGCKEIVG